MDETSDKKQKTPGPRAPQKSTDFSQATVGAYNPELTAAAFVRQNKQPWNASFKGRLAIRLFSRGILGAAFFTAGGLATRKMMHSDTGIRYDQTKKLMEQENPLQFIAKLIDIVAGTPIKVTVRNAARLAGKDAREAWVIGEEAVRFRQTKFKGRIPDRSGGKAIAQGRSLGNEAVNVTFDFFCASVGDAWGRDIAGWFDPNVKKSWIKDGHIDIPRAVEQSIKSVFRYLTYNGGEDWAVAIPYSYFMKGQRAVINRFSPFFAYDFDRQLHGGSHKMKWNEKTGQFEVIGNFNLEGALDLQTRFTVYNMGTLMFRELYDFVNLRLHGKQVSLYGAPDKKPNRNPLKVAGNGVKWFARSIIKGGLYMTPATFFFWITRTPQTNYRGLFIDQEKGVLSYDDADIAKYNAEHGLKGNKTETAHANDAFPTKALPEDGKVFLTWHEKGGRGLMHKIEKSDLYALEAAHPAVRAQKQGKAFNPHAYSSSPFHSIVNGIGWANNRLRTSLDPLAEVADRNIGKGVKKLLGLRSDPELQHREGGYVKTLPPDSFKRFTHPFVNASLSYTPYMFAKGEFAHLWDNGKMDTALERMIDGATGLRWGEFAAGTSEVWRAILHKPFKDPAREAEAKRRVAIDITPPDDADHLQKDPEGKERIGWRERVVQGRPEDRPEVGADKPKGYAEREEMREALKEMVPPTNSIN